MSLKLTATLLNIFSTEPFKDKESGEIITKARTKLQLMMETKLRNGDVKKELLDVSIPAEKINLYGKDKIGKEVTVDVAYMSKEPVFFYGI